MRHRLKPLAYLRYGDDFILFFGTRREARFKRTQAQLFLRQQLGLRLNPKNDAIVPSASGLHFLGHAIMAQYAVTDKHTTYRALQNTNLANAASYLALQLTPDVKRRLYWQLTDEAAQLLDKNDIGVVKY